MTAHKSANVRALYRRRREWRARIEDCIKRGDTEGLRAVMQEVKANHLFPYAVFTRDGHGVQAADIDGIMRSRLEYLHDGRGQVKARIEREIIIEPEDRAVYDHLRDL